MPLQPDTLFWASLSGNLGGHLLNHVGTVPVSPLPWNPGIVNNIFMLHPGIPLGAVELHAAAIAFHLASGQIRVSQAEVLTLQ